MKNKKKLIIIIAVCCVVIAGVVFAVINAKQDDKKQETTTQTTVTTTAQTTTEEETVISVEENTLESQEDQSTTVAPTVNLKNEAVDKETTKAKKNNVNIKNISQNYWYLFDDENYICYAFKFNEKGNKVDLAYFSPDVIQGLDAKFTTGYSVYKINGNDITMKNLPDEFPIKKFTFTVKNNKVYYNKTELVKENELNLQTAIAHYV